MSLFCKTLLIFIIFMFNPTSFAFEVEQETNAAQPSQAQQIKQLQAQVQQLAKKIVILNKNQQSIAKKIGLGAPPKQPSIAIGESASIGNQDAKIVLVEFTDLHCPFCKKFHDTVFPELKKQFIDTGELRFVGKHFPLVQLHKNAAVAAFALECAREDDNYEQAKNWLFKQGKNFSKNNLNDFTQAMGLDNNKFTACVESPITAAQINSDIQTARTIGIHQTPSFAIGVEQSGKVVNWKIITGAQSVENFGIAIDEISKQISSKD